MKKNGVNFTRNHLNIDQVIKNKIMGKDHVFSQVVFDRFPWLSAIEVSAAIRKDMRCFCKLPNDRDLYVVRVEPITGLGYAQNQYCLGSLYNVTKPVGRADMEQNELDPRKWKFRCDDFMRSIG